MARGKYKKMSKAMKRERTRDFETTNDVNAALFANLMRSTKKGKKQLTRSNSRTLDRMRDMQKNLDKAGRKSEGRFRRRSANADVGGMMGAAFATMGGDIAATNKAGRVAVKGEVGAAKTVAKSAKGAVSIIQAGAREARANADALAADALTQRAQVDATTIATMKHDEAMMRLQARLAEQQAQADFERQQKLFALEETKLEKEEGLAAGDFKPAVASFSALVPEIIKLNKSEEGLTHADIKERLLETGVLSAEDAATGVVDRLIYNLTTNTQAGPDSIVDEFIQSMSVMPSWGTLSNKQRSRLKDYIKSSLSVTTSRYRAGEFASEDGGDGGGGVGEFLSTQRDRLNDIWGF
jgi:hypothetical protein